MQRRRRVALAMRRGCAAALATAATMVGPATTNAQHTVTTAGGTVVVDSTWSQALGAWKSLVVYLPPSYAAAGTRRFAVAYYLHGADGDETDWVKRAQLNQVMDSLVATGMPEMIVAMPDGDNSWYATYNVLLDAAGCRRMLRPNESPERDCVAWPHYDDYVAYDVVRHMDANYRTMASRAQRAIAGLSMGGYGAVTLALQYPATFSAAASHSGVLSPLEFAPAPFGRTPFTRTGADSAAAVKFGTATAVRFRVIFGSDRAGWMARDPATLAARLVEAGRPLPALYLDCGTSDVFLPENRAFVEVLASRRASAEYHEWPGTHSWTYWRAHVGESLAWIASRIAAPGVR